MAEEGRRQRYTPSVLVTPDQMEELSKAFETVGCRSELDMPATSGSGLAVHDSAWHVPGFASRCGTSAK